MTSAVASSALESLRDLESAAGDDQSDNSASSIVESSKSTSQPKETETSSESSTLARRETTAVNRSKMMVLGVLCLAAAGVGAATYVFTRNSETREFEGRFHDFAIEMEELIHDEAKNVFRTVENFATTITSEALANQAKWPFVSVPHFEIRGIELNTLANSLMIGFSPIVDDQHKEAWELYSSTMQGWIQEGVDYNVDLHKDFMWQVEHLETIQPHIFRFLDSARGDPDPTPMRETQNGPYLPVWQQAPAPHDPHIINYNLFDNQVFDRVFHGMNETLSPVLSEATQLSFYYGGSIRDDPTHPHSFLLHPIFQDFNKTHRDSDHIMGAAIAILPWDHYFENILPPEAHGMIVLMENSCGDQFSYVVNGPEAIFLGYGDYHDPKYTRLEEKTLFAPFASRDFSENYETCEYDIHIYPSWDLESDYRTDHPVLYTFLVICVFVATTMVFVLYDFYVTTRQNKVMLAAKRSNAVVASLFPKNVRERMLREAEEQIIAHEKAGTKGVLRLGAVPKNELKNFLDDGIAKADGVAFDTKPIADLFPNTTIMFGDICGFTAWSSVREPTQVFTLLETLYHAFDEIAKRRRVFKVETIGDCYVAVAGLPEPRKDHANVMARFARDCLGAMNDLTKKLEVTLGPDTGELAMRVGLHSGPVTAGVLRGDKSRFQLFGDTVNTASRIETTGARNRIHVSKETADLLKAQGKGHWLFPRKDKVQAKGKGFMDTFWLDMKKQSSHSETSGKSGASSESDGSAQIDMPHLQPLSNKAGAELAIDSAIPAKIQRRVQWNVDVLLRLLKQVVARRNAEQKIAQEDGTFEMDTAFDESTLGQKDGHTVLEEVQEIIHLPKYNAKAANEEEDPSKVEIPNEVIKQLHEFVTIIASLYHHDNPFHNFEHASHVTMSVTKLLSRIVTPEEVLATDENDEAKLQHIHDHTYGITSDPLTQFAVAFSALIHDVDHSGVPNAQLIKEHASIAAIYKNQSVAEQNSVDLSWNLLLDDTFKELRSYIYGSKEEMKRFRQLVVNVVLATDICDKQLKELRNNRWEKAFSGEKPQTEEEAMAAVNRKATIVLEHLIQASDVAHTMQHWHIYRKWNEAFFLENMQAYKEGRAEKDPTEFWYKGELGFFDFYIIPLAKKLKNCGVFGVSSDEYLNYALSNRKEWEVQGEDVVATMAAKYLPALREEDDEGSEN